MRSDTSLGLIGFLIGGAAVCYFEYRPSPPTASGHTPQAAADGTPEPPHGSVAELDDAGGRSQPVVAPRQVPSLSRRASDASRSMGQPQRSAVTSRNVDRTKAPSRAEPDSTEPETVVANRGATSSAIAGEQPGTDSTGGGQAIEVRLHRILVGGQVAAAGLLPDAAIDEHDRHGRYLVYFDIGVHGASQRIGYEDFRLEDGKGLIYMPIATKDALGVRSSGGATARGGVAFAVYDDAAPARLLRRSGPESFTPLPESIFRQSPR